MFPRLSEPGWTLPDQFPSDWSVADLQRHLGGIPLERIRLFPPPGFATEEHVTAIAEHEGRLYELDEGVLVEKPRDTANARLVATLHAALTAFVTEQRQGRVLGPDRLLRVAPGVVKIPDVSFVSAGPEADRLARQAAILALVPALVVEVPCRAHTAKELAAKRKRYLEAGVRMIWTIHTDPRSALCSTVAGDAPIPTNGVLDGGDLLVGLRLAVGEL